MIPGPASQTSARPGPPKSETTAAAVAAGRQGGPDGASECPAPPALVIPYGSDAVTDASLPLALPPVEGVPEPRRPCYSVFSSAEPLLDPLHADMESSEHSASGGPSPAFPQPAQPLTFAERLSQAALKMALSGHGSAELGLLRLNSGPPLSFWMDQRQSSGTVAAHEPLRPTAELAQASAGGGPQHTSDISAPSPGAPAAKPSSGGGTGAGQGIDQILIQARAMADTNAALLRGVGIQGGGQVPHPRPHLPVNL